MDDDIISQGGARDPGPWPRRLTVIAALIVLVVGGGAYLTRSLVSHPSPVTAGQTRAGPTAAGLPPEPEGIAGQTLAWDRDLRLPTAGARPVWFSPATGGAEPIGGLPPNRSGYQFTRVAGGWAIQASQAVPAGCASCAGPPTPAWFLPDGAQSVTMLGTASLVAPAGADGAVWLTSYPPGANRATASGTAREAGTVGAHAAPVRLPPGYAISQGTVSGLLLAPVSQQPGARDELWNRSAGKAGPVFAGVLAASPDEIAWTPRCAGCVQVLNLATGKRTEIALPAGSSAVNAAFSPDGGFLALQLSVGSPGDGGELGMRLEVAPVITGRLTPVPGTWVSSDALIGFGWPAAGDSLVARFSFTTKMELTSWSPGASRPAVKIIPPGSDEASLILGLPPDADRGPPALPAAGVQDLAAATRRGRRHASRWSSSVQAMAYTMAVNRHITPKPGQGWRVWAEW